MHYLSLIFWHRCDIFFWDPSRDGLLSSVVINVSGLDIQAALWKVHYRVKSGNYQSTHHYFKVFFFQESTYSNWHIMYKE